MTRTLQTNNSLNLLTVPQAAEKLRVSKWMIYKLINRRELVTLTIGRRRFVDTDDLVTFINGQKGERE